jgi:hypothetical protein
MLTVLLRGGVKRGRLWTWYGALCLAVASCVHTFAASNAVRLCGLRFPTGSVLQRRLTAYNPPAFLPSSGLIMGLNCKCARPGTHSVVPVPSHCFPPPCPTPALPTLPQLANLTVVNEPVVVMGDMNTLSPLDDACHVQEDLLDYFQHVTVRRRAAASQFPPPPTHTPHLCILPSKHFLRPAGGGGHSFALCSLFLHGIASMGNVLLAPAHELVLLLLLCCHVVDVVVVSVCRMLPCVWCTCSPSKARLTGTGRSF